MNPSADNDNSIAADILKGADEIAAFLGLDKRAVYYAISRGAIPTFEVGLKKFARKSTLMAWIAKQEGTARVSA